MRTQKPSKWQNHFCHLHRITSFLLFKEVNQQAQNNTDQYGSTEWEVKRPVFSSKSKVKWIFNAILFSQ